MHNFPCHRYYTIKRFSVLIFETYTKYVQLDRITGVESRRNLVVFSFFAYTSENIEIVDSKRIFNVIDISET